MDSNCSLPPFLAKIKFCWMRKMLVLTRPCSGENTIGSNFIVVINTHTLSMCRTRRLLRQKASAIGGAAKVADMVMAAPQNTEKVAMEGDDGETFPPLLLSRVQK